jgi:hypothetical protein
MKPSNRIIALIVSLTITTAAFAGVGSDKAVYRGGTIEAKAGEEGMLDLKDATSAVYRLNKKQAFTIPYSAVTSLEYGQKAGRRIGAAVATTILVTPLGLAMLLSKKRKHIVTIAWSVDGKNEAAVFEMGKDIIRPTLVTLEARTGKKVEYESEDAKKNIGR